MPFRLRILGILAIGAAVLVLCASPNLADGGAPAGGTKTKAEITRASSSTLFADVPADHWALADLQFLAERGIITGFKDGKFHGDQPLTRYAAVALIARAIRFLQSSPDLVTSQDLQVLQDLIYKINDKLQELDTQVSSLQNAGLSGADLQRLQKLETKVQQNTSTLQTLQVQVQSGRSTQELQQLRNQASASFIIALAGLFVGIIGIALATM